MFNSNDSIFSLYISGIKLSEINPLDSAKLLEALCALIGSKNLKWDGIIESSADYRVRSDCIYLEQKLENFNKAIQNQTNAYRTIMNFLTKYPSANTDFRFKKSANDDFTNVYKFERKSDFVFTQKDKIRGRIVALREGKDQTDHIQIKMIDGKMAKIAILPTLSCALGEKWRTDHQLEFSGIAKYRYKGLDDLELIEFFAEHILEVQDKNLKEWINDFKTAGSSGWDEFENPINEWLKERYD